MNNYFAKSYNLQVYYNMLIFSTSSVAGYILQNITVRNHKIGLVSLVFLVLPFALTAERILCFARKVGHRISALSMLRLLLCSSTCFFIGIQYNEFDCGYITDINEKRLVMISIILLTIISTFAYFVPLAFVEHDERLGKIDAYKKRMKLNAEIFAFGSVFSASLALLKILPKIDYSKINQASPLSSITLDFVKILYSDTSTVAIYMAIFCLSISASCLKLRLAYLDK